MKVLLKQQVKKLGQKGDVVEVNDGYSRNFLFPKGLAIPATDGLVKQADASRSAREDAQKILEQEMFKALSEVKGKVVVHKVSADDGGHLYAGLHAKEVVTAINGGTGRNFHEAQLSFDEPIKKTGEHEIKILIGDKSGGVVLNVVSE